MPKTLLSSDLFVQSTRALGGGWGRRVSKRRRIAIVAVVAAVFMAVVEYGGWQWWGVVGLLGWLYAGLVWVVEGDFRAEEWLVVPLPLLAMAVAAVGWLGIYAWHPWLWVGGSIAFGVAVYGLVLTLNIINIATVRALPLARTAYSILSLSMMATSFVLYYLALYSQPSIVEWLGLVVAITVAVGWPQLWVSGQEQGGNSGWVEVIGWQAGLSLVMVQLAALLGMWPRSFMTSLCLAVFLHIGLGVIHYQQKRQIHSGLLRQYGGLFVLLLVVLYVVTGWYGG